MNGRFEKVHGIVVIILTALKKKKNPMTISLALAYLDGSILDS